jgi:L-cysteine/cystine lyase
MPDLAKIRAALPALQSVVYLNSGTAGPLPTVVAHAMRDAVSEDEQRGRASGKRVAKIHSLLTECRSALADLVHVAPDEIALTSGTTEGLAIILDRLVFAPGDRIVTSNLEHPDIVSLLEALRHRWAVDVVIVSIDQHDEDAVIAEAFADALSQGARLTLVSHVAFNSGRVLPVAGIAAATHAADALLLVDGAQAVGAIDVDIDALSADFYAFPGQKWLMGPEGSGALVIRRRAMPALAHPAAVNASSFERGTTAKSIWAGVRAALAWRVALGGEAFLAERIAAAVASLRTALAANPEIELITPSPAAGLVTYRQTGASGEAALDRLSVRRIAARTIAGTDWVRLSSGFFLDDAEIAAVGLAVGRDA